MKPPVKRATKYGGSASVQAVTRVNAEQSSKWTLHRPTRSPFRGRLTQLGDLSRVDPSCCVGVVATACTQGRRAQHGKPLCVIWGDQPNTREGAFGRIGVAERLVVPWKPSNVGGGKGPQFKTNV